MDRNTRADDSLRRNRRGRISARKLSDSDGGNILLGLRSDLHLAVGKDYAPAGHSRMTPGGRTFETNQPTTALYQLKSAEHPSESRR